MPGLLEWPRIMQHSCKRARRALRAGALQKAPMSAPLAVEAVSKVFPGRAGAGPLEALKSVSFTARHGEFISIIGPSGCGKTTLLRIVHGLDMPTEGGVRFDGRAVSAPDQSRAVIFQHFN